MDEHKGKRSLKTSIIAVGVVGFMAAYGALDKAEASRMDIAEMTSNSIGYWVTNESGFHENEWNLQFTDFDLNPYVSMIFGNNFFYNVAQDNTNDRIVVTSGYGLSPDSTIGAQLSYDTTSPDSPFFGIDFLVDDFAWANGQITSFAGSGIPTDQNLAFRAYGNPVDNSGPAPVPEPGTYLLLGSGLLGLAAMRRKWNRKDNGKVDITGTLREAAKDDYQKIATYVKAAAAVTKDKYHATIDDIPALKRTEDLV